MQIRIIFAIHYSQQMMHKFAVILIFCLWLPLLLPGQYSLQGHFPGLAGKVIKLEGYRGTDPYLISETKADAAGKFSLSWSEQQFGRGFLLSEDNKSYFVILCGEELVLEGSNFANATGVNIRSGVQNQLTARYISEHGRREQALAAWTYLEKMYRTDSLFSEGETARKVMETEMDRIAASDEQFLAQLDPNTYIAWYLPIRKLISDAAVKVKYRPDQIPDIIKALASVDYTEDRLYASGLLKDLLDYQFQLIQSGASSATEKQAAVQRAIDGLVDQLSGLEDKLSTVTGYLFKMLEQSGQTEAAGYLSLRVLNDASCSISDDLGFQLESYRKMAIGAQAPDISFNQPRFAPAGIGVKSLKELDSTYKIVIFGASWCQHCQKEIPELIPLYGDWKKRGVEVLLVSLDENVANFDAFTAKMPFLRLSDFNMWASPIVAAYHVFSTPSIFVLDKNLSILEKPRSVRQLNAWIRTNAAVSLN